MGDDRVEYWSKRWGNKDIGWHKTGVNNFLSNHIGKLTDGKNNLAFLIPLCGKTIDMKWLYDLGHTVVGIEGVEQAILDFFKEQSLEYVRTEGAGFSLFKTPDSRLKIYLTDLFKIPTNVLGKFDAIWDRGSLVAIYPKDRELYAKRMKEVAADKCKYLVAVMHHDPEKFAGPPRNVFKEELFKLYEDTFNIEEIDRISRANVPLGDGTLFIEDSWEVLYLLRHK
ncbi:probable thiopurine S-methyltransferase isoform X2 [Artemia franciscana]|uniref:thiopurine S-methyltransferase n=2 Tax=Artemia franciscana TaxID=6661 RepID=A0AA88I076_ARTSF|nr:hypothetical protein QYM36_008573 [Artemia franciscana]KAK2714017.1 hypothetical protein QYM36_008573 [Artemia franciscana]